MIHLVLDDELCFILRWTNSAPLPCGSCAPSFVSLGSCTSLGSVLILVLRVRLRCVPHLSVLCSGSWSCLGHPQPPWRTRHGCTVGVNWDPPVCSRCQAVWHRSQSASPTYVGDELRFRGDVDYRRDILRTTIAMKRQPDEEILNNVFYHQLQQSDQLKPLLSLYIQDTVQKVNRETTPDLKRRWSDTWNRKTVRSMSLLVQDNLKKPTSGAAAAKGRSKGRGKRKQWRLRTLDNKRSIVSRR